MCSCRSRREVVLGSAACLCSLRRRIRQPVDQQVVVTEARSSPGLLRRCRGGRSRRWSGSRRGGRHWTLHPGSRPAPRGRRPPVRRWRSKVWSWSYCASPVVVLRRVEPEEHVMHAAGRCGSPMSMRAATPASMMVQLGAGRVVADLRVAPDEAVVRRPGGPEASTGRAPESSAPPQNPRTIGSVRLSCRWFRRSWSASSAAR